MPTIAIVFFATNIVSLLIGVAFGRMVERVNTIDTLSKMTATAPPTEPDYGRLYAEHCAQQQAAQQAPESLRGPMHTHFDL